MAENSNEETYKTGNYTGESWSKLENTWNTSNGGFRDAFGAEAVDTDELADDAKNLFLIDAAGYDQASRSLSNAGDLISQSIGSFSSWDGDQYAKAGDAALAASIDFLNRKLSQIKKLFTETSQVTVGALLQEAAPYAKNPSAAWNALSDKFTDLAESMTSRLTGMIQEVAEEGLTSILTDERFVNSVANINAVQGIISAANAVNNTWNAVSGMLKMVEPLIPPIEIIAAWSGVWTNPSLAAEATNKSTTYGQMLLDWALSKATALLKKYVFSMKLTVPNILLSSVNGLSIKEEVDEWSWGGDISRGILDTVTNNYDGGYSWNTTVDSLAAKVTNSKYNTNRYSANNIPSMKLWGIDYGKVLKKSLANIVVSTQTALGIDSIAAETYSTFSNDRITFTEDWSSMYEAPNFDIFNVNLTVKARNTQEANHLISISSPGSALF